MAANSRWKGQNKRMTITLGFALIEYFQETGVGTGAKRSRRRVQFYEVRLISRCRGGDSIEADMQLYGEILILTGNQWSGLWTGVCNWSIGA